MKTQIQLLSIAACGLLVITTAKAHHSTSTYDLEQQVTIVGSVTRLQWVNPHVFVFVDQITDSGQSLSWAVEGVNPAGLRRIGWSRDTVKLGDIITVTGNPSNNMVSPGIYPQAIFHNGRKLFDEQEFFAGIFSIQEAETGASNLAGVWKNILNPAVIIPRELETEFQPGVGLHEVTQIGLDALAQFDELTMNPALNCEEISAPLIMHFGDHKEIRVEDDLVRIISEYDGGERVIYMDVDSHDSAAYSIHGHSIGQWESDTLVVDTTHFSENNFGNGFGLPSSRQKHLRERFTLSDDGKTLSYQFTLSDPVYLASPMSLETQWSFQPGAEIYINECNLESARRYLNN